MELKKIIELIDGVSTYSYVKKTLRAIGHSFKLYDLKNLFICFNGGKDAEIVLHLVRLALYKDSAIKKTDLEAMEIFEQRWREMKIVYFEEAGPLPEVETFMKEHSQQYDFTPIVRGKDVKKETYPLVEKDGMKAIFLGTRRVDPYSCELEVYAPSDSDKGWAPFMRIHPIIDWSYEQVWRFLRDFQFPYCCLYDKGYTHLGNITNSGPNEFLMQENGEYLPAYKADGKYEHFSRTCYEATQKYLDTKHFIIVYKKVMTEIIDTMKSVNKLFGKNPHISVIEFDAVSEFVEALVGAGLKPKDITVVYVADKVSLDDLKAKIPNLEEFKTFEGTPHHR